MLKNMTKKNIKLLFTDTYSLCYEIKTDDVYKDLFQDKKNHLIIVITQKIVSSFFMKIRR